MTDTAIRLSSIIAAQAESLLQQVADANDDAALGEIAYRLGMIDELLTPEYAA